MHSKAFRRLKHKTQVFISPEGDHYRTRLTHTLEACGIARNVARALGLNEDLTEAIGLGHDLGHPPFGHIGEHALDELLQERYGVRFRHNEHSLRMVERLENDGHGLNLTEQVRDGILNHTGAGRAGHARGPDREGGGPGGLHQPRHRRRPARRGDRPRRPARRGDRGPGRDRARSASRRWWSTCSSAREAAGDIVQGEEVGGAMLRLREFMFEHVYLAPGAQRERGPDRGDAARAVRPLRRRTRRRRQTEGAAEHERVVDYLAGMTDRYAVRAHADLSVPQGF